MRVAIVELNRHLAGGRNREKSGSRKVDGHRIRAFRTFEVDRWRLTLPRGAVDDRLPIGGEPGRQEDRTAT